MRTIASARIAPDSDPMLHRELSVLVGGALSHPADGSDVQLIAGVKLAMYLTGHAPLRKVDIEVSRGVVMLWGRVPTYYQKQLAQAAAQRVEGVLGIANGLQVSCTELGESYVGLC